MVAVDVFDFEEELLEEGVEFVDGVEFDVADFLLVVGEAHEILDFGFFDFLDGGDSSGGF